MLKKKTSGCHEIHTSVEQILEFKEMKGGAQEGGKGMATNRNHSLSLASNLTHGLVGIIIRRTTTKLKLPGRMLYFLQVM